MAQTRKGFWCLGSESDVQQWCGSQPYARDWRGMTEKLTMKTIIALALFCTLAACGGGGDSQVEEAFDRPTEHFPTPIPPVPASAPTP